MNIQIKRWDNEDIIFEGDYPNIKSCLEAGVAAGRSFYRAKLNDANLNYANLNGAKLNYANLNGANLNDAKLNGAKLNNAELNGANLNDAELNGAELNNAELNGAELNSAYGNTEVTYCLQHGIYKIVIVNNKICHGGCTTMSCDDWLNHDGKGLNDYDLKYLESITKPFIRMCLAAQ